MRNGGPKFVRISGPFCSAGGTLGVGASGGDIYAKIKA